MCSFPLHLKTLVKCQESSKQSISQQDQKRRNEGTTVDKIFQHIFGRQKSIQRSHLTGLEDRMKLQPRYLSRDNIK